MLIKKRVNEILNNCFKCEKIILSPMENKILKNAVIFLKHFIILLLYVIFIQWDNLKKINIKSEGAQKPLDLGLIKGQILVRGTHSRGRELPLHLLLCL